MELEPTGIVLNPADRPSTLLNFSRCCALLLQYYTPALLRLIAGAIVMPCLAFWMLY